MSAREPGQLVRRGVRQRLEQLVVLAQPVLLQVGHLSLGWCKGWVGDAEGRGWQELDAGGGA